MQVPYHLEFIDTIGETIALRNAFDHSYALWQEKKETLVQLQLQEQEKEQRRDFLQFQIQEIRAIEPVIGEDESLSGEKKRLKSAETLIKISRKSHSMLSGALQDGLTQVRLDMCQVAELDTEAEELATDLGSLSFLTEDRSASQPVTWIW